MHGVGNDYIFVDTMLYPIPDPQAAAIAWSRPHMGIGSDGLVLIGRSTDPEVDFTMRIFNADGSEGLMCGNASRCIGKYVYESGLTDKTSIRLMTASGIKILQLSVGDNGIVEAVTVDMLEPKFNDKALYLPQGEPLALQHRIRRGSCRWHPHARVGTWQWHHHGMRDWRMCHRSSRCSDKASPPPVQNHHGRRHPRHRVARARRPRLSHRPRHPRL